MIVKFKPVLESEEDRSSLPYKYTEPPAQRDADGWCVIEDKFLLVGMLNMPWQSGDICMAPSSHSGSVDLTLLRVKPPGQSYEMTRFELIRLFSAMQDNGAHIKDKRIEYFCCKEIEITPREEQAATIDGELHSVPTAGLHVSLFAKKIACVK